MAAQAGGGLEAKIPTRISYIVTIPANIVPWYRSPGEAILQLMLQAIKHGCRLHFGTMSARTNSE
jgi:hypothetical protein